jgi:hypothetical protein
MFTQKEDLDKLEVQTDTGGEIAICFNNGDAYFLFFDGYEFDIQDDILKSMFILVKKQYYSLLGIVQKANAEYEDICAETRREMAEEERHTEYLRSPSMTGRI